jgi:hypothetical protein
MSSFSFVFQAIFQVIDFGGSYLKIEKTQTQGSVSLFHIGDSGAL